jgi:hypothetical protein
MRAASADHLGDRDCSLCTKVEQGKPGEMRSSVRNKGASCVGLPRSGGRKGKESIGIDVFEKCEILSMEVRLLYVD